MSIKIGQANLEDLEALSLLFDRYRQFYGKPSDIAGARQFLLERITAEESICYLAFENNTPIGFVQLYPSFSSVSLAKIIILNDLYVLPEGRRKGAAQQLIQASIEYARKNGSVRLTLSTAITNNDAQSLYQAMGWEKDEAFLTYTFQI
jgi:GNAT superfamily N-acetyltransferase